MPERKEGTLRAWGAFAAAACLRLWKALAALPIPPTLVETQARQKEPWADLGVSGSQTLHGHPKPSHGPVVLVSRDPAAEARVSR